MSTTRDTPSPSPSFLTVSIPSRPRARSNPPPASPSNLNPSPLKIQTRAQKSPSPPLPPHPKATNPSTKLLPTPPSSRRSSVAAEQTSETARGRHRRAHSNAPPPPSTPQPSTSFRTPCPPPKSPHARSNSVQTPWTITKSNALSATEHFLSPSPGFTRATESSRARSRGPSCSRATSGVNTDITSQLRPRSRSRVGSDPAAERGSRSRSRCRSYSVASTTNSVGPHDSRSEPITLATNSDPSPLGGGAELIDLTPPTSPRTVYVPRRKSLRNGVAPLTVEKRGSVARGRTGSGTAAVVVVGGRERSDSESLVDFHPVLDAEGCRKTHMAVDMGTLFIPKFIVRQPTVNGFVLDERIGGGVAIGTGVGGSESESEASEDDEDDDDEEDEDEEEENTHDGKKPDYTQQALDSIDSLLKVLEAVDSRTTLPDPAEVERHLRLAEQARRNLLQCQGN